MSPRQIDGIRGNPHNPGDGDRIPPPVCEALRNPGVDPRGRRIQGAVGSRGAGPGVSMCGGSRWGGVGSGGGRSRWGGFGEGRVQEGSMWAGFWGWWVQRVVGPGGGGSGEWWVQGGAGGGGFRGGRSRGGGSRWGGSRGGAYREWRAHAMRIQGDCGEPPDPPTQCISVVQCKLEKALIDDTSAFPSKCSLWVSFGVSLTPKFVSVCTDTPRGWVPVPEAGSTPGILGTLYEENCALRPESRHATQRVQNCVQNVAFGERRTSEVVEIFQSIFGGTFCVLHRNGASIGVIAITW